MKKLLFSLLILFFFQGVNAQTPGWWNMQWPANGLIEVGEEFNVYSQVWVEGVTGNATAGENINAWIGYSLDDTDPATWTNWVEASFLGPSGNNDEYICNIGEVIESPGVYYYASRFQYDGGDMVYGGFNSGEWNGVDNVSGVLTVNGGPIPACDLTFQVDMQNEVVSPDGVFIAGNFNGWSGELMENSSGTIWTVTYSVDQESEVQYKFQNGEGVWEDFTGDCLSGGNRFLTVPSSATFTIDLVCFNSCDPCGTIETVDVTFQVDMQNEEVSSDGVFIAGSFNSWSGAEMENISGTIWEKTVQIEKNSQALYKFQNGVDGWEIFSGECLNDDDNRFVDVAEENMIIPVVCFNSCDPCSVVETVEVTFQVDMQNELVSPDGTFLAGNFNEWSGEVMENISGTIWTKTVEVETNSEVQYKFINGVDVWESISGECLNGEENRFAIIEEENVVIPVVCFNSCDPCAASTLPPPTDLEASVNQSDVSLSWVAPADETPESYNIYRNEQIIQNVLTTNFEDLSVPSDTYIYYIKAVYSDGESVPSNEVEVTITVGVEEKLFENEFNVFPNPTSGNINITVSENCNLTVYNRLGQNVFSQKVNKGDSQIDLNNIGEGIFFITIERANTILTKKILIEK